MLIHSSVKPTTDPYSSVGGAALFGQELPLVRVVNPAIDVDPNTAALSPTDARVVAWPDYGFVVTAAAMVSILGGVSLVGRFWLYDTTSAKWIALGNLTTTTVGAAQGALVNSARSKRLYWQSTTVTGAVTDLFYGLI
jgi:hypothetical protein